MTPFFQSEREVWEFFRGPQGKEARKELRVDFKRRFPQGHSTSIRGAVEFCTRSDVQEKFVGNSRLKYLRSFHPRAFALLLAYGQDYIPLRWKEPPKLEPLWRKCFQNAHVLLRNVNCRRNGGNDGESEKFVYVEGFVDGACAFPMLHAWNAKGLNGKTALDCSWYSNCRWYRYFGIPFTDEEFKEACLLVYPEGKKSVSLLHKNYFPKVEYFLHELLARREEARMQEKLQGR